MRILKFYVQFMLDYVQFVQDILKWGIMSDIVTQDKSIDTAHENKYYPHGLNYNLAITGERDGSQYILDLRNENDSLDEIERWLGVR